jgi:hypothetical protein
LLDLLKIKPFQATVLEECYWPSFALQHANVPLRTYLACVSLHRAGGALELAEILNLLETLKEQQQQLLTEQQQNYQGLVLDLFHPTSSIASSKELKRYRDRALVFYHGSSSYAEYTCMVTGMECSAGELVAGHIYRQQWPKSWLVSNFLPTSTGQCSRVQERLRCFLTEHFGIFQRLEPALGGIMHSMQVALFLTSFARVKMCDCPISALYCYCYMVQALPEHPVGSQRGSWGTSVIVRIGINIIELV